MTRESLQSQVQQYVDLAAGLSKATRERATAAAKGLLSQAGLDDVAADASEKVTKLAEEVLAASRANRELMGKLIATEVERAAAKLGFARQEDLDALRAEIADLRVRVTQQARPTDTPPDTPPEAAAAPAKPAGRAAKRPAKKSSASGTPTATAAASRTAPAKKVVAKKAPAKKVAATAPAKKATATKAPAKKTPAKRTTTGNATTGGTGS